MERGSYEQYARESNNWLHRGRRSVLIRLLGEAARAQAVPHVLEVGAGVGQNLPTLAQFGAVDAAEIDELGVRQIREQGFSGHLYTERIPFELQHPYNIICALDVIEHLEDDRGAVQWIADGLVPGGHFIASVPAHQWLFGEHDTALGHFRRYNRKAFLALLPPELEPIRAGYFNTTLFPAVAAIRGLALLRRRRSRDVSAARKQSSTLPAPADWMLGRLLGVEARVFARRPIAPFGLSFFVLARKR